MDRYDKIRAITHSFREIHHALWLVTEIEAIDITGSQFFVLSALFKEPNLSLGELADRLKTGSSTMSGIVDRLSKAELIIRERSKLDRRTLVMRLTPLGEEKRKQAKAYVMDRLSGLANIRDEDIEQLLRLHQDILSRIHLEGDVETND